MSPWTGCHLDSHRSTSYVGLPLQFHLSYAVSPSTPTSSCQSTPTSPPPAMNRLHHPPHHHRSTNLCLDHPPHRAFTASPNSFQSGGLSSHSYHSAWVAVGGFGKERWRCRVPSVPASLNGDERWAFGVKLGRETARRMGMGRLRETLTGITDHLSNDNLPRSLPIWSSSKSFPTPSPSPSPAPFTLSLQLISIDVHAIFLRHLASPPTEADQGCYTNSKHYQRHPHAESSPHPHLNFLSLTAPGVDPLRIGRFSALPS
jgi:hypothetical protein